MWRIWFRSRRSFQFDAAFPLVLALVIAEVFLSRNGEPRGSKAAAAAVQTLTAETQAHSVASTQPRLDKSFGKLPLSFELNRGQTDAQVKFLSRARGYALFLTGNEAVLSLPRIQESGFRIQGRRAKWAVVSGKWRGTTDYGQRTTDIFHSPITNQNPEVRSQEPEFSVARETRRLAPVTVRLQLVGANLKAKVDGLEELPGKSNYFIGNDPKKWCPNVPTFAKVLVKDVYPGIDMVYHGKESGARTQDSGFRGQESGRLEFDFVVHPGGNPNNIRLAAETLRASVENRQSKIAIGQNGDLVIPIDGGEVRFRKPMVYQEQWPMTSGKWSARAGIRQSAIENRKSLDGHYVLAADNRIHFEIAGYDKTRALIIDPVLVYSTYLGGSSFWDAAYGIAVDSSGNAYVAGTTYSPDFPTANALQKTLGGPSAVNAFVAKLNAAGSALVYSTYLGGSSLDGAHGIAVDSSGNVYVTGRAGSQDFPTTSGAFQTAPSGGTRAFVSKLSPDGSRLVYSTYLRGTTGDTSANGIALGSTGNAFVTGETDSPDFPTTSKAFQPVGPQGGSGDDAFVTEFTADGSGLVYSTYLGGGATDIGNAIAVDSSGSAYIAGQTDSSDFPLAGLLQLPCGYLSAFVAKLSPDGSALPYSTCPGTGSGGGIAVDAAGDAYVTGWGQAGSFPTTPGAFQTSAPSGMSIVFVTGLNAAGSALIYSTYLSGSNFFPGVGGAAAESGTTIAINASGNAYVGGFTNTPDFPAANPIQATSFGGGCATATLPDLTGSCGMAFVTELNPTGSALIFSTYFGGSGNQGATGIALDTVGNIYIAGETSSTDLPTINPLQPAFAGGYTDAFVAKIGPADVPAVSVTPLSLTFGDQAVSTTSAAQTIELRNMGSGPLAISSIQMSGDFGQTNTCGSSVAGGGNCSISVTFTPAVTGSRRGTLTITDSASGSPHTLALAGTGVDAAAGINLSPTTVTFAGEPVGSTSSAKTTTLTSSGTDPLTIFGIAASGDFAQTNNCGNNLPAAASCTISITFHPTAAGVRNGTITIADDSPGTPHVVSLVGAGEDFSFSASPITASVTPGQSSTYTLNVGPAGGFNQTVNLSCAGAPTLSTCTVSPASVTLNGSSVATATVTIATTAPTEVAPRLPQAPFDDLRSPLQLGLPPRVRGYAALLWLVALFAAAALSERRRRRSETGATAGKRRATMILALAATAFAYLLAACGGGVTHKPGTPAGTYTITLTGTDTQATPNLSHSTTVTLTVSQ